MVGTQSADTCVKRGKIGCILFLSLSLMPGGVVSNHSIVLRMLGNGVQTIDQPRFLLALQPATLGPRAPETRTCTYLFR